MITRIVSDYYTVLELTQQLTRTVNAVPTTVTVILLSLGWKVMMTLVIIAIIFDQIGETNKSIMKINVQV